MVMKKKRSLILSLFVLIAIVPAKGQGQYGKDSAACVQNLSFYTDYMKQNNFAQAAPPWRKTFEICPPNLRQNIYLDGQKIMRHYINLSRRDPVRQKELIDTLIMLYDMRLENFPQMPKTNREQAKTNKALDMINYVKDNDMAIYKACEDAMEEAGENSKAVIIVRYMDYAKNLYNENILNAEDVMNAYNKAVSHINKAEAVNPDQEIKDARTSVEGLFLDSGVANCDNLITLFTPQFESNKTSKEFLQKVVSMLNSADCLDSDLFIQALTELNNLEPSHTTAYYLYRLYAKRDDKSSAIEFLKKAIDAEDSDSVQDGAYYYELSLYYFQIVENRIEAVANAKRAAQLNSEVAGRAYFLIGNIWGGTKCSGNEIEQRSPFWVAVDYMTKAKSADSSLASDCNKAIESFSKFFPLQADAFMYDILEGSPYTVSCGGFRETTTVRTQK